jgi:hypothetical protein
MINRFLAALAIIMFPISAMAGAIGQAGEPAAQADTIGSVVALNALNVAASVAMNGQGGSGMLLAAGTLVGTLTPELSFDGGSTYPKTTFFYDPSTLATSSTIVFGAANPATALSIIVSGGATNVRVRISTFVSGTANASLRATAASAPQNALGIVGTSPGTAALVGSTVQVQPASLDPCATQTHVYTPINIPTSATAIKVPGTAGKKTYVCALFAISSAATTFFVAEGTGLNCGTNNHGVIGGSQMLGANAPISVGGGNSAIAATDTVGEDLCFAESTGTVVIGGVAVTAQQ